MRVRWRLWERTIPLAALDGRNRTQGSLMMHTLFSILDFFFSPFFLFLLYISYIYFSSLLVLSSITQTELSFFLLAASAAAAATAAADEVGAVKLKR